MKMQLDYKVYEQARLSRDARFDGRFFVAVTTTGIYCRTICPALLPKARNVRFYPSSAAATEAGYRPCLRCRPESAPGTPVWLGTPATVIRALRMIDGGALDEGSVEQIADRLGVTARHLHRLFIRHLGAAPVAVAQARRLQIAKKLIDETNLPMTEVAFASGFGSIRRFNAAFQKVYARPPGELRRDTGRKNGKTGSGPFELRLSFRPPYDWDSLISYLSARATPGVELAEKSSYRRTIRLGKRQGVIEVVPSAAENNLQLRVWFPDPKALYSIAGRIRRLFDLDAVPDEVGGRLSGDALLAPLVESRPGLRVPGCWDGFELAVRAILGQQVTVKGATTLAGRLVEKYGDRFEGFEEKGLRAFFPTARRLARANLSSIGLPKARARTIRALARAVADGKLSVDASSDRDDCTQRLLQIPGIGPWTAEYVAMRALGDPDAFPAGDLGLLRAASNGNKPNPARLAERAAEWRPWRAYAAMHLWKTLEKGFSKTTKGR